MLRRGLRNRRIQSGMPTPTPADDPPVDGAVIYAWYDFDLTRIAWYNTAGAWGAGRSFSAPTKPTTGAAQTAANDAAAETILGTAGSYLLVESGDHFGDLDITDDDIHIEIEAGGQIDSLNCVGAINRLWINGEGRLGTDRVSATGPDGLITFNNGVSNLIMEGIYMNAPYKYGIQGQIHSGFIGNMRAIVRGYFLYPQRGQESSNDLLVGGCHVWSTNYSGPGVFAPQSQIRFMDGIASGGDLEVAEDHVDYNEGIIVVENEFRAFNSHLVRVHGMGTRYITYGWNVCDGGGFLASTGTQDVPDVHSFWNIHNNWRRGFGPRAEYGENNVNGAGPSGPLRYLDLTGNTFKSDTEGQEEIIDDFEASINEIWVRSIPANTFQALGSASAYAVSPIPAPVADAGSDDTVEEDTPLTLAGTSTLENYPLPVGAVAYEWTQTVGSGTATFDDDTDPVTDVTFDDPDDPYTLQLEATYNGQSDTDTVDIEVTSGAVAEVGSAEFDGTNDALRRTDGPGFPFTFFLWCELVTDLAVATNGQVISHDRAADVQNIGAFIAGTADGATQGVKMTGMGLFMGPANFSPFNDTYVTVGVPFCIAGSVAADNSAKFYWATEGDTVFDGEDSGTASGTFTPTGFRLGENMFGVSRSNIRITCEFIWSDVKSKANLETQLASATREPFTATNLWAQHKLFNDGSVADSSGNARDYTEVGDVTTSNSQPTNLD